MSKKMVLSSLLVSTTVLTTPVKADVVTFTSSSDVVTTQDTEQLIFSDESMNVLMEEPQTEISTSTTDMSNSDATMSSSVSEEIVGTVGEITPTETEVILSEEEDAPDQVLTTTQVTEETTMDTVSEPINDTTMVGTLKALQMLPDTSSTSGKSSIIIGVMTLLFGLIGLLHMYAKRIFG